MDLGDRFEEYPKLKAIADTPCFVFLWVGDGVGLDVGRVCLKKWGFRRCEDICWIKTNRSRPAVQHTPLRHGSDSLFQHTKEHCLMGIKGTVRRSTDGHIIHANVDTDVIISEEPPYAGGSHSRCASQLHTQTLWLVRTMKPEEMYHIIEHFAQGRRRLELFGEDHNIRQGWVTVGKSLTSSNFTSQAYAKHFAGPDGRVWSGGRGNPPPDAPHLLGTTPEVEALRPKSPPMRSQPQAATSAPQSQSQAGTASNATGNKK
eukprot:jgi/Mesen1/2298/ME000155S01389